MINPTSLSAAGRTVKCAKCGAKWHQDPAEELPLSDDQIHAPPPPVVTSANLPVTIKPRPTPLWLKLGFGFALLICLCVTILLYREELTGIAPGMQSAYDLLGIHESNGLALKDVSISRTEGGNRNSFLLQGEIINRSAHPRHMPILRVSAMDTENGLIRAWEFTKKDTMLKSGEAIPFQTRISFSSSQAEHLVLDIGNFFDISLRH